LRHVEIAWNASEGWIKQMVELLARFPSLSIGAAGVVGPAAVAATIQAGCRYAVSPVLEPESLREAECGGMALVPGVLTPSEIQQARRLGCRLVKLFPAVAVGREYWRRLREPLGDPLPFCIAAGGLTPEAVAPWLEAGVDAVALGSSLALGSGQMPPVPDPFQQLLSCLPEASHPPSCGGMGMGSSL
jgi:2-dehydro-3-deoxyphosphogluconate aldolase/(4S)-4-hydroxy-2-oxoglutarate aldolase